MIENLMSGLFGSGKNTPNKFTIKMGENIRKARLESGLSQAELAKFVYVSQAAISDMENGKREVSSTELLSFSNTLNKPLSYFFPEDYLVESRLNKLSPLYLDLLMQAKRLSDDDLKKIIAQIRALIDFSED